MPIFQPVDLSGCFGWFKADSVGWGAVSGYVTYWPDDSGSGNYLDMAYAVSGAVKEPVYFPNVRNGYPAVYFNGNNRIDSHGDLVRRNFGAPVAPSSMTLFTVFSPKDVINAYTIWSIANDIQDFGDKNAAVVGIGGSSLFGDFVPNNQSGFFLGWGKDTGLGDWRRFASNTGIRIANDQWVLRTDKFDPTARLVWRLNGADVASGIASTSYNSANYITFGVDDETSISYRKYKGYIAEVVMYNRRLNNDEITQVESYLRFKYAIDGTSNINLFVLGADGPTGIIYSSNPSLYVAGASPIYSGGISLYEGSSSVISSGLPLYVNAASTYSSGRNLYIGSSSASLSGLPLYVGSSFTSSGDKTLYTMAGIEYNFRSLYTLGNSSTNFSTNLYTGNSEVITSGYSIYMSGSFGTRFDSFNLYTGSSSVSNSGISLFIGNSTSMASNRTLYTSASLVTGLALNLLYTPGNLERSPIPLNLHGYSTDSNTTPMYIGSSANANYSSNLYSAGMTSENNAILMFLKQNPRPTGSASISLFTSSPSVLGTSGIYNSFAMYMDSFGVGGNMPLFLKNTSNAPDNTAAMPLYVKTAEVINTSSGNVSLFIYNNTEVTGRRVKLYIRGDGVMDGASILNSNMNLFIKQKNGVSQNVSLYIPSFNTVSTSNALYTKGVYNYNSGTSLFITGRGITGVMPLYIQAGGSLNSGMSLYSYNLPSITTSLNTYIYGF